MVQRLGATRYHEAAPSRIFREISRDGEISRSDLARRLSLKASALEAAIRPLLRQRLLFHKKGSRKIALNADYGRVVGIDMGASHLHFALADFCGEILSDTNVKIRPEAGPRKIIAQIKQGVRDLTQKSGHGRLQAVALGVPSPVDPHRGLVAYANNLPGWKNIHLSRELGKAFRVPVFLENDANMAAIGEHWRGVARDADNFIFIALGTGIGSGIFADGKLYRGRTGAAGELYRMNLEWPRWAEDFGELGYVEKYVSGIGIAAEGRKALSPSQAQSQADGLAQERDAYFVFEAFRQGSPEARAVLEKIFTMLGVCIANVVAVLDPDLIVLGGGVTKGAPEFLLDTVTKVVRRIHPDSPPVKLSSLEDKAQTYGAIFSALSLAYEACVSKLGARWRHSALGPCKFVKGPDQSRNIKALPHFGGRLDNFLR